MKHAQDHLNSHQIHLLTLARKDKGKLHRTAGLDHYAFGENADGLIPVGEG